jgi:uncharacterized membrane protein
VSRLRFILRQLAYDADRGLLVRPGLIVACFAAVGVGLPHAEATSASLALLGRNLSFAVPSEPGAVQLVLATIAGGVMTVVSIVYSVLVVAMSLASIQYSPRILAGFLSDRVSQRVLGLFIGTFTYCLLVLRAARSEPTPFVPSVSVLLALLFALVCLGSLLFFVHHMTQAMQANYIVDKIARETERVLDAVLPPGPPEPRSRPEAPPRPPETPGNLVRAVGSGYVQLVAVEQLLRIAEARGVTLHVVRAMGQFAPDHGILVVADGPLDEPSQEACRAAFDLGPVRTMQDDVELGVRQIVDIALKAISPAVNDPSTAVTCIDQLSRILGRAARRGDPEAVWCKAGSEQVLVVLPSSSFSRLLDLAMNQLRQYGRGDVAVLLRLVRALSDVADISQSASRVDAVRRHVGMLRRASAGLADDDRAEVDTRLAALEHRLGMEA